jgi:hypothetical protein
MNHFETVIDSDLLPDLLKIPSELKHKKVKLIILPAENETKKNRSLRGIFEKYKDVKKIPEEKTAWEEHVVEENDYN